MHAKVTRLAFEPVQQTHRLNPAFIAITKCGGADAIDIDLGESLSNLVGFQPLDRHIVLALKVIVRLGLFTFGFICQQQITIFDIPKVQRIIPNSEPGRCIAIKLKSVTGHRDAFGR